MRDILFRGKNLDGRWVQGSYLCVNGYHEIVYQDESFNIVVVKPETVGQFTGFEGKKGEKVFEGDVIELEIDPGEVARGYVMWDKNNGCWAYKERACDPDLLGNTDNWMVVGNIWDNPELMEEKKG